MQVWKYLISPGEMTLEIPKEVVILTVQVQKNTPVMWCLVDESSDLEYRRFLTVGTGHNIIYTMKQLHYIGTFQLESGNLVFHTFEVIT